MNNPYYYHPQPHLREAADAVLSHIASSEAMSALFEQGKMLGVLLLDAEGIKQRLSARYDDDSPLARVHYIDNIPFLTAFSGVVNGLVDDACYFVPPIYDLQQPDDFYLQKDAEITLLNRRISDASHSDLSDASLRTRHDASLVTSLKQRRAQLSLALQREIFAHFDILNPAGQYKNVIDIFADAKRGLPPGGTGECAAPRLLQYAYQHGLRPLAMGEFWYGVSPKKQLRVHGHFYPSCIEKCSPLLRYMEVHECSDPPTTSEALYQRSDPPTTSEAIQILHEDAHLIVLVKPSGLLSVPAKDLSLPNVETILHTLHPEVKGPMLAHRLDQATSGLMLAAKDAATHKALQLQFENKSIQKHYTAQVRGHLHSRCGIISLPLCVNPDDRPRQIVSPQFGKAAVTLYEVMQTLDASTLLRLTPLTGRTHQLRVHCASPFGLDHAILGDTLYDILDETAEKEGAPRLMLHAEHITLVHPVTGETMSFDWPLLEMQNHESP